MAAQRQGNEVYVNFDEARVGFGDLMQLQVGNDTKTRASGKLLGYLKGSHLIVTQPDDEAAHFKERQNLTVRFFTGQNVYTFMAFVVQTGQTPVPHLWLSYPAVKIRGHILRDTERVDTNLVCNVATAAEESIPGTLTDLSIGGASVVTKAPLGEKGAQATITFKLRIRGIEADVRVVSEICNSEPVPDGTTRYGVKYTSVDKDSVLALTAFVYQTMMAAGRK